MTFHAKSLTSSVLVVVSLLIGYFGIYPQWNKYNDAQSQLKAAQAQEAKLEQAQRDLDSFLSEYRAHTADAEMVNNALPLNKDELYNILQDLDQMAKTNGLELSNLNVIDTFASDKLGAQDNSIRPIDITFDITGDPNAFRNFVGRIESNLRLMDIQSVNISNDDSNLQNSKEEIKFRTYYQK